MDAGKDIFRYQGESMWNNILQRSIKVILILRELTFYQKIQGYFCQKGHHKFIIPNNTLGKIVKFLQCVEMSFADFQGQ